MLLLESIVFIWVANSAAVAEPELMPRPHYGSEIVQYPEDYCKNNFTNYENFDFIVVGSGPGGAVVARRLAEVPSFRVLLLEAGDDPPVASDIPGNQDVALPNTTWTITSKPNNQQCQGMVDNKCSYKLGKYLGGCSVVNRMMYVRGNHEDYNEWEKLGNPEWGYTDVLEYFRKLENHIERARPRLEHTSRFYYHDIGGPLSATHWPIDPLTDSFRTSFYKAIKEKGYKQNHDANGENQIGFTNIPGMIQPLGYRDNIAKAYLMNIPNNLKVCKKARVTKINISLLKTAESVDFVYGSGRKTKKYTVIADKEIVLSAGALNTPQILERSGIGKRKVIKQAGVKLVHELPGVGENLMDQFINYGTIFNVNYMSQEKSNPLTIGLESLTGWLNLTDPSSKVPDTQFGLVAWTDTFAKSHSLKPEIESQLTEAAKKSSVLMVTGTVLRPRKTGYIHITSSDPDSNPSFDPSQFTNSYDNDLTIKAAKLVRSIMKSPELEVYKPKPFVLKECKKYAFNSDKEIMCQTRIMASTTYHMSGTASMGPKSNSMAVVDPRLKVHGIKRLRVIDASIMPLIPRGTTEVPTVMIAEKGAAMIEEDHGKWYNFAEKTIV